MAAVLWTSFFGWCLFLCLLGIGLGQVRPANDLQDALQTLGLTKFLQRLKEAGLSHILYNGDRYTLFAPSNEAFARLETRVIHTSPTGSLDPEALKRVLLYHVAYSDWRSSDWTNEQLIPTALPGMNVRVNIYESPHQRKGAEKITTISGVQVLSSNNRAGNGIVHVLDDVIYPNAGSSIYETITSLPDVTRFRSLLDEANLRRSLRFSEPLTVFAPVNEAFKKLPPQFLENMSSQVTAMAAITNYHIVNGTYYSAGMFRSLRLHSMESSEITVDAEADSTKGQSVKLNVDVSILQSYPTTNGVLHLIDTVLLPPANPKQMFYSVKQDSIQKEQFKK